MSAGLTIGIKMADSATAVLQRVQAFNPCDLRNPPEWNMQAHVWINPMLLAFSMELALKAWFVFDYNEPEAKRGHNLSKLFDELTQESQNKLDTEFRRSIAPIHLNFFGQKYGIKDILDSHGNAFVDWRYLHETIRRKSDIGKSIGFHESAFVATLEMVLSEFRKRYREEQSLPTLRSE